jgi:hypothetical protein
VTDRPGDGAEEPVDPPELVEPPAPRRAAAPVDPPAEEDPGPPTEAFRPPTDAFGLPTQPADLAELQADDGAPVANREPIGAEPHPTASIGTEPVDLDSWLAWPPGAPPIADEASGALGELFAEDSFHDYSEPPPPPEPEDFAHSPRRAARAAQEQAAAEQASAQQAAPALAAVSPFGMPPDDAPAPIAGVHAPRLVWIGLALVAVIALLAVFLIGTRVPSLTAGPTPVPTPTVTGPIVPVATAAPGEHDWTELGGGECLKDFTGAFAQTFDVVACDRAHQAQLVYRAPVPSADGTYPGASDIEAQLASLCTRSGVVDLGVAAKVSDLQLSPAYPVTGAQWDAGQRDFFCFVDRSSGKSLTRSVMGDAQQKEWTSRGAPKSGPVKKGSGG